MLHSYQIALIWEQVSEMTKNYLAKTPTIVMSDNKESLKCELLSIMVRKNWQEPLASSISKQRDLGKIEMKYWQCIHIQCDEHAVIGIR
ncbi:hypothetical protein F546_09020 [Vibrio paracholerae 877-163]|nr:hypothetical protein F546_09020 [Vibrio paracholerae 877-163]ORP14174.1 hypothetical protein B7947_07975 [Vibrio paracholerae]RBM62787.1 hypothetical protein DLR71_10250 [Vibrio paracholerae]